MRSNSSKEIKNEATNWTYYGQKVELEMINLNTLGVNIDMQIYILIVFMILALGRGIYAFSKVLIMRKRN